MDSYFICQNEAGNLVIRKRGCVLESVPNWRLTEAEQPISVVY